MYFTRTNPEVIREEMNIPQQINFLF